MGYLMSDTPWVRPAGFDHLVHKVWNKSLDNNDDGSYFVVNLEPNCWVPQHHHPTGAFYAMVSGGMHFPGEGSITQFEARWTAPGHFYAGERGDKSEGALIGVLGTDLGPQFIDSPPPSNYLEEHRTNLHVVYRDSTFKRNPSFNGELLGSCSLKKPRQGSPAVFV